MPLILRFPFSIMMPRSFTIFIVAIRTMQLLLTVSDSPRSVLSVAMMVGTFRAYAAALRASEALSLSATLCLPPAFFLAPIYFCGYPPRGGRLEHFGANFSPWFEGTKSVKDALSVRKATVPMLPWNSLNRPGRSQGHAESRNASFIDTPQRGN